MAEPWGHRIQISAYVEGELPPAVSDDPAVAAAEAATEALEEKGVKLYYVGVSVIPIAEEPKAQ